MEKVTYGASRYVDWVAQIKVGSATVRVHFTGGALTNYGVTPAEFTTSDPFVQKVIEQSSYFKEGRIKRLRSVLLPAAAKPASKAKHKNKEAQAAKDSETTIAAQNVSSANAIEEVVQKETAVGNDSCDAPGSKGVFAEIAVSCFQDAQDYLQQQFGIPSYKVRSYESAQQIASENGIVFVGAKFAPMEANAAAEDQAEDEE